MHKCHASSSRFRAESRQLSWPRLPRASRRKGAGKADHRGNCSPDRLHQPSRRHPLGRPAVWHDQVRLAYGVVLPRESNGPGVGTARRYCPGRPDDHGSLPEKCFRGDLMKAARKKHRPRRRLRRVAVLPSVLTLLNAVCGFAAIHFAARGMNDPDALWLHKPPLTFS